jgi:hypothetical protein
MFGDGRLGSKHPDTAEDATFQAAEFWRLFTWRLTHEVAKNVAVE